MEVATWILVVILSITLFIFLVAGTVLVVKLISVAEEAKKVVTTGQKIALKADDIVDNVKGFTSVGGIVRNFARRTMDNQERRYARQDARREAEEIIDTIETVEAAEAAMEAAERAEQAESDAEPHCHKQEH